MNRAERKRQSVLLNWVAEVARLIPDATFHDTGQEDPCYNLINVHVGGHHDHFITHYWGGGEGPKGEKVWTPQGVHAYFAGIDY
jgi:hypothetical protein